MTKSLTVNYSLFFAKPLFFVGQLSLILEPIIRRKILKFDHKSNVAPPLNAYAKSKQTKILVPRKIAQPLLQLTQQ